jgi:alkyl hydroperoxide reductase subunit AhpC
MSTPLIGRAAPFFSASAVVNGEISQLSLSDYAGRWVVLFFYPLDWTFVCPTEILEFSDNASKFKEIGADVIGVSVDSIFSHLAWINTGRKQGGLGGSLNIPLVSDVDRNISTKYGAMYLESGHTLRATYIIDPKGNIRHLSLNDPPVGRSVCETLRLVQGYQFVDANGEVCPMNWTPGAPTIKPDPSKKLEYFEKVN